MKFLLFSACVLLFVNSIWSQGNDQIEWGNRNKKNGFRFHIDILNNKKELDILSRGKKHYLIRSMDASFNLRTETKIPTEYNSKNLTFVNAINGANDYLLFYTFSNKRLNKNFLLARKLNPSTLVLSDELIPISSIEFEKRWDNGDFIFKISENESKILIYSEMPYSENEVIFDFKVYSSNLEKLWEKRIAVPYNKQKFNIEDIEISDNGNVFISGYETIETSAEDYGNSSEKKDLVKIIAFNPNSDAKEFEFSLEGKKIYGYRLKFSENNLFIAGLYGATSTGVKGAFSGVIDQQNKKLLSTEIKEFEKDFIIQGWSEKEVEQAKKKETKKKKEMQLYNYKIKDFVLLEDGSLSLIAEQYHMEVHTSTYTNAQGNTRTTTTYHYYYNDIIVLHLTQNGKIEWITKINKHQHGVNNDTFLSYALHVKGNNLTFIYNERAKEYFKKENSPEIENYSKKAFLGIMAKIDNNGKVSKEILINNSEEHSYLQPKLCKQRSKNEIIIYSQSLRAERFGILTIK